MFDYGSLTEEMKVRMTPQMLEGMARTARRTLQHPSSHGRAVFHAYLIDNDPAYREWWDKQAEIAIGRPSGKKAHLEGEKE